jgi:uncharacterized membrane-anchored protein
MEKDFIGKGVRALKGVLELNWKILLAIIVSVIAFIIIFLIVAGILRPGNLSKAAGEICLLMISKLQIFGMGAEKLGICDTFLEA